MNMNRQNGVTLVEIVISLGIGLIGALIFASLALTQVKYTVKNQNKAAFIDLVNEIRTIVSESNLCNSYFGLLHLPPSGTSLNYYFNHPLLQLSSTPPYNRYGPLTVTGIALQNVKPVTCPQTPCPGRRSFDLIIQAVAPSKETFSSTINVLVTLLLNSPNQVAYCANGAAPTADQLCGELGLTWNPTTGCSGGTSQFTVVAQPPLTVPDFNTSTQGVALTTPVSYSFCFLTGMVGGGLGYPESCQITGQTGYPWTITGTNHSNPPHTCEWSCLR